MQAREWIGAYYLSLGGYMAKNEWITTTITRPTIWTIADSHVSGTTRGWKGTFVPKYGQWIEVSTEGGFVKGHHSKTIFLDPGHGRDSAPLQCS